ncbi:hypothetical protein TI04_05115, partial [Achromatium sp. WMS2]
MTVNISSYFKLDSLPPKEWIGQTERLLIGYPEKSEIFFLYKPLLDKNVGGNSEFYRLPKRSGYEDF